MLLKYPLEITECSGWCQGSQQSSVFDNSTLLIWMFSIEPLLQQEDTTYQCINIVLHTCTCSYLEL